MNNGSKIDPERLTSLFPLSLMTKAERELLAEQLTVLKGKKGRNLVECGDADNKALYVLSGKIRKESQDGQMQILESGAQEFKSPVSFAIPHKCTVSCLSTVEYFRLENHVIANLLERKSARATKSDITVNEQLQDNPLFKAIYKDLTKDRLVIPTLPKVAMAVRKAIEDDVQVRKIELLLQADPALATLLIKTANSALYRTHKAASSIEQAIMRMGLRTVKSLVTSYSLKHLYTTKHKEIKKRMKALWIHSTEVAAVCYVLGKNLRNFDPEQALLMGLLHNVGELPILSYAERYPEIASEEKTLDATIASLKAEVGMIILSNWQFSQDFITVARESENWLRDEKGPADYTDLVIVAKLHTYIGREHNKKDLPQLYEIPAFQKLGLDQYDPNKGLAIIADANEQINEVRRLLAI